MLSRRNFGLMAMAATTAAAAGVSFRKAGAADLVPTTFSGVRMGECLYNFRDIPRGDDQNAYVDKLVDACRQSGAGLVEINIQYFEPKNQLPFAGLARIWDAPLTKGPWSDLSPEELKKQRDALRQWRLTTPASYFHGIRKKFVDAGLTPFSYVITFTYDMTDPEIDAIFRQAQALGVSVFSTNQTKVELAPRLAPFAERYKMDLGFHNHTQVQNPNEVASLNSFERLFSISPRFKANLDVGHYVAADQDALAFVKKYSDRLTHLHMKDRKRNNGPGTVWGEGDAPLKEILVYLRDTKSTVPCIVEYEYKGAGTGAQETARCINFMKAALA